MYLNLRRQPGYRPVSSKVGDHLRILLGVVVHIFLRLMGAAGALSNLSHSDLGVLGCMYGCVLCVCVLCPCVVCVFVYSSHILVR